MMTDPKRDERVMSLAAEALETPLPERDGFLQSACQNDPGLYREVSEVVTWEERMRGFLHRPLIEFIDLEAIEKVFEPGQTVSGRFEILRCVGDGGMGVVYEAFDRRRKQRIAIKCAKPGFGRLLSPELEGALKVRHPNICLVNEIHTSNSEFGELDFLTMEFLDGETLSARLARGKLEEVEAAVIARQLCAGVAEAHRSGVLHRDLKPGNVILCPRKDAGTRAVITDFGLATESSVSGELAGGTPGYMAPELSSGGKPSQASDVFALGVILYEMVTGGKPFPQTERNGAIHSPAAPSKLVKNLPRHWDQAILPCLGPEPQKRCTAEQALAALERKPPSWRPAVAVVLAACLASAVATAPRIIDYFKPAPIHLAVLPVEGPGDLAQRGQEILGDVAVRVRQMQVGKAKVSVIPLDQALRKGVATPQQALKGLGATHALQLKLHPEPDGINAEGTIIDLHTMAHVRDYYGHFLGPDFTDLPAGLAGSVALGLHIQRAAKPETVAQVATAAFGSGLEYLEREPQDFLNATREFQEAARLDPHSALPLAGLAEAHVWQFKATKDQQALDEAKLWLAKAEALNADSTRVRLSSGLLHQMQGDHAKALEDYQRVEEVEPDNAEAWLGSGLSYESQGSIDKATTDYQRAIAVEPNGYKPYVYLGAFYFFRSRYAEAEEEYKKAIERAPNRVDIYGSLAGVYTAQFKYPDAEKVFRTILQLKETTLTFNNLGVMLAFQGRDSEAIHYYERALQLDDNRYTYWLNLGDAQRRLGKLASAKSSYRRGLSVAQKQVNANPASSLARAYLAYLHARLGFTSRATSEIAQAWNSPGKNDQVLLCAVETYEALRRRTRAIEVAGMATAQTLKELDHRPNMADLRRDPRFRLLISKIK